MTQQIVIANIDQYLEFNPLTIAPDTVLQDAVALIAQQQAKNQGNYLLIAAKGKLVGILTQSDIIRLVATKTDLASTTVEMVMTQPVLSMLRSQSHNLDSICSFLQKHAISYLPILEDEEIVGVINGCKLNYLQSTEQYSSQPHKIDQEEKKELGRFFEIASMQCIVGFNGYFIRTNSTLSKVLGFTPNELLTKPIINFIHPDDRETTLAELENLRGGKTTLSFENRFRTKDGDYRWLLWTAKPYVAEKLIYAAARDITERKNHELAVMKKISDRQQTEKQLQQERDFSAAVINTVGALIAVIDRQGEIVSFNHTCEKVTGYYFEEVQGKQIWNLFIPPDEKQVMKAVFERLLKGQFHSQYENHWLAKDGSKHLISWSNTALFDAQGEIEYIIATGIDVTEQRRVWNKLELQYQQTKLLTETTRKIRMSIDLKEILQTTVTEIQHLLACDRVLIMEIKPNHNACPISEALLDNLPSMLGYEFADPLLMGEYLARYHQGKVLAINDLEAAAIDPNIKQLLKQFQIQAKLVVPILSQSGLKGLLVAHQCHHPRQWQEHEIHLLNQLADQIGVALSQAQLLNYAEQLVEERTKELTTTNELLKLEIVERRQTQERLQTSTALLAKAEKIAKIGSWEYDHENNQRSWSEELFNILDFAQKYPTPPSCQEILARIHPEDLLLVKTTLRAGHQQGKAWQLNYRLQLPDGTIKYIESRGEPTVNSEGKVLRVLETIMDVSERIQTKKSLQRSEAQLKLITDALPVLIAYIDNQQCYRYNNRTYESWYGKPRSTLLGKTIREVVGEHNYQEMLPHIKTALAGKTITFESQLVRENGNAYWMNATYVPDFNAADQVKGFFSMIEDITERKAVEQMKSEFISIASHEMRTPLTTIHGVIKLLAAGRLGQLSESGAKMAAMALRNGDRLVRLVNDILDLERMESGRDEINRQQCNSAKLIRLAMDTVLSMAEEQQIILVTHTPGIKFFGDRDRLVQTLSNLLSNAIKFSPTGSTICLSAQATQQNILFAVKDQGRGIPQEQLESIFERFQQVDASDSRQKGGTGLGLAICRHIVEQHGGKIWAESIYGQGSTFLFSLPLL